MLEEQPILSSMDSCGWSSNRFCLSLTFIVVRSVGVSATDSVGL